LDSKGNVWIGTGYTVDRFDITQNRFIHYIQDNVLNTGINKIYKDKSNTLWIGTNDGLYKFDEKLNKLIRY
jgi:ligand-binding sensor domain-containing protein